MTYLLYTILALLVFVVYRLCLLGKLFNHVCTIERAASLELDILRDVIFRVNEIVTRVEALSRKLINCESKIANTEIASAEQLKAIHEHLQVVFALLNKQKNG